MTYIDHLWSYSNFKSCDINGNLWCFTISPTTRLAGYIMDIGTSDIAERQDMGTSDIAERQDMGTSDIAESQDTHQHPLNVCILFGRMSFICNVQTMIFKHIKINIFL